MSSSIIGLLATILATASVVNSVKLPTGIIGFNSGNTFPDYKAKFKNDWTEEFVTAQKLVGSPGISSVRLYTMIQEYTESDVIEAIDAAVETNTTMLLGIWCSRKEGGIDNELVALKKALDKYGDDLGKLVVGVSVGSEDLYRISEFGVELGAGLGPGLGPNELIGFIRDVKEAIQGTVLADKPIGHVDVWSAWANESNSAVIDEIDFIGADIYPYYEKDRGNSFDNVTNLYDFLYGEVEAAAGDTPIWITETGYPVTGPLFGDAETGVDLAQMYWEEIGCGKIFGRMNVWWYNLRDSNPANKEKFAITNEDEDRKLSEVPRFNLTCPAELAEDGAASGEGPGPTNPDGKDSNSAAVKMVGSAFVGVGVTALAALLL